jgi:hypothetical protein
MTSIENHFPAEDHDLLMSVKELKHRIEEAGQDKAEAQRQALIERLRRPPQEGRQAPDPRRPRRKAPALPQARPKRSGRR